MTETTLPRCEYCGEAPHLGACPRVRRLEYEWVEDPHNHGVEIRRVVAVELHHPEMIATSKKYIEQIMKDGLGGSRGH